MNRPSRHTLIRYFQGKSLPHEIEPVDLYLAMDIDRDYVESCLKEAWEATARDTPQCDEVDLEALKQRFQIRKGTLGVMPPLEGKKSNRKLPLFSLWIKIAAAVIVLVGASTLFTYKREPIKPDGYRLVDQKEDILPGGDKALLMLADGKTISLSDAANGALTEQAGLQIEKTAEGEIRYRSNKLVDEAINAINSVVTPKGGQYRVTLPDGSKAWLNAASSLSYPVHFEDRERRVKMTGEVYFEIAKVKDQNSGKNIPFFVETDDQEVQVLGTRFNVSAYADEPHIRTTLVEGSVRVTNTASGQSVLLRPGEQSMLASRLRVQSADIRQELAWTNGEFIFKNTNLGEVLRQLSRWYDLEVRCPPNLKERRLSGTVSRSTALSTFVRMIESTSEVTITVKERGMVVSE